LPLRRGGASERRTSHVRPDHHGDLALVRRGGTGRRLHPDLPVHLDETVHLMSLWRLLRSHLTPFRSALAALVVLQALQATATLLLPTINASLFDEGILAGDQDRIIELGTVMLGVAVLQVGFAVAAMWFGADAALG